MNRQNGPRGLDADARMRALELARKASGRDRKRSNNQETKHPSNQGFSELEDFQKMIAVRKISDVIGLKSPYFRLHQSHAKTTSLVDGKDCLNFSSYDYLGLNADPRPAAAAKAAIDEYGVSASASRMVAGERPIHRALEAALKAHYNTEAAQVFVSGHATNVSVIAALVSDGDLIVYDSFIHNSVTAGAQMSSAARRSFPHGDMAALERILEQNRAKFRNVLVVVEGLYSMDGDVPDLPGLIALRDRYGLWLMVDEAHALGCVGRSGKGSFEHFDLDPSDVDIWMGTMSKTLSSTGGYIAGCADLIDFLRYHADGFVFSVAHPPALAASALCALDLLNAQPELAEKLHANARHFQDMADSLGLNVGLGQGYGVMPIMVGDSVKASKLSERLLERGVNVAPVVFPGVPMQKARLRFFLSAAHTHDQITQALKATKEELSRLHEERFGEGLLNAMGMTGQNARK